jgi:predicted glutamine amidotransferase
LQQFDKQRSRGTEGFGLFDGQEMHIVRATKEDKILKWLVKYNSNLIMFHHRYPTSTDNVKRAAHPFSTKDYFGDTQYILVHNGVISNDDKAYDKHQKLGITYTSLLDNGSFNDSESLLWDVALLLEGKQDKLEVHGSIAFICLKTVKGKLSKMYFGRNHNPLKMYQDENGIMLSSEGVGDMIERDMLYEFDYKTHKVMRSILEIPAYSYVPPVKHGYNYDMYGNYKSSVESNWERLRSTIGGYLANEGHRRKHEYDYDRDGNPLLPVDEYGYEYEDEELINPILTFADNDEEYEKFQPIASQVQSRALGYLEQAEGNFEDAYMFAEMEYEELLDYDDGSPEMIREQFLLEEVLEFINKDPEYKDDTSVSSLWSNVCNQQQLLTL